MHTGIISERHGGHIQRPDHRQKRFLDALILPLIKPDVWARANESISGDQFDPLCRIKTHTLSTSDVQEMLNSLLGTPNEHLIQLYPIYFRSKRQIQHVILQKQIRELEPKRRQALMACHLKQQAEKQTTQTPYPDFPEFHEIFVNTSFTTTTTTTTPVPSYRVFSDHTTLPPPRLIRFKRHDTHTNAADITTVPDLDYDEHSDERSGRQFLMGLGAVGGVLGTIFGLFNQMEMHNIERHVSRLETSHNMLIQIAHKNTQNIHALTAEINHLDSIIETLIQFNPALVYAKLMSQVEDVADHLDALLDTVQQLMHQKLSVKLLSLHQLHIMFESIQNTAKANDWTLLIKNPQDVFQLDVSYIRKNADVIIMLHVPCLTDNHLLTIYRYANLPLPVTPLLQTLQANQSLAHLQPVHTIHDLMSQFAHPTSTASSQEALHLVPETDLIAIGRNDGLSHRYKLLTHSDLAACVQRNHIFLCEGHQVLRTDLEGSCLGSIYLQSERGVRENCKIERKLLRESVFQISATDHLVVSPYPHTSQITCKNGTHFPIRIRTTSRIRINPGCSLKLFNHTLRSDQSIRIKPEPLLFPWDFNPLTLPSELMSQAQHLDNQVNQLKTGITTILNDTVQSDDIPQLLDGTITDSVSTFSVLFWGSFAIAILALALLVCWYCGSRRRHTSTRTLRPDELPMTISQIAGLNLPDADGRR